jgi:transcriptional regulator with XRE-family HTH domain
MKLNLKKINQEMERLGLNQTELARRMGISRQLLNYYLQRDLREIPAVERLAKQFNIPPKDLLI